MERLGRGGGVGDGAGAAGADGQRQHRPSGHGQKGMTAADGRRGGGGGAAGTAGPASGVAAAGWAPVMRLQSLLRLMALLLAFSTGKSAVRRAPGKTHVYVLALKNHAAHDEFFATHALHVIVSHVHIGPRSLFCRSSHPVLSPTSHLVTRCTRQTGHVDNNDNVAHLCGLYSGFTC